MQYYVVLFKTEKEKFTSMVPETWVDNELNKVWWPPKLTKKEKMADLVVDQKLWSKYTCTKILGPYDYEMANTIETVTINISTDEDTDTIETKLGKQSNKRIPKPKKPYIGDSESSTEHHETGNSSDENEPLPSPPRKKINSNAERKPLQEIHNKQNQMQRSRPETSPTASQLDRSNSFELPESVNDDLLLNETESLTNLPKGGKHVNNSATTAKPKSGTMKVAISTNKRECVTYATKSDIKELTKEIIKCRKSNELLSGESNSEVPDDEIDEYLPLSNVEDLNKFNKLINENEKIRRNFKQMLRKIGGSQINSTTYSCLRKVMTDKLAMEYSYSGQSRGKNQKHTTLEFKNSTICKILVHDIARFKQEFTEKDCISAIQKWLNNAKIRYEYALKVTSRLQKSAREEAPTNEEKEE